MPPDSPSPRPGPEDRRPAVFLDRDGTIIKHVHYLADPAEVRLLPNSARGLRRLAEAGFALVGITNQSAIGRGMISVEQYERVDAEMRRQLADEGVSLDGVYYCPEVPAATDPTAITRGDRKPGPGMLLRAARELGLDPSRSWMIGDMISDALAGYHAGCEGNLLVRTGKQPVGEGEVPGGGRFPVVDDLQAAADLILGTAGGEAPSTGRTTP